MSLRPHPIEPPISQTVDNFPFKRREEVPRNTEQISSRTLPPLRFSRDSPPADSHLLPYATRQSSPRLSPITTDGDAAWFTSHAPAIETSPASDNGESAYTSRSASYSSDSSIIFPHSILGPSTRVRCLDSKTSPGLDRSVSACTSSSIDASIDPLHLQHSQNRGPYIRGPPPATVPSIRPVVIIGGKALSYFGIHNIPGRGIVHLYENGYSLPATASNGRPLNPARGMTKNRQYRKRVAKACVPCRCRKSRCEPTRNGCVRCDGLGLDCWKA